jgi:hypothetical protein
MDGKAANLNKGWLVKTCPAAPRSGCSKPSNFLVKSRVLVEEARHDKGMIRKSTKLD